MEVGTGTGVSSTGGGQASANCFVELKRRCSGVSFVLADLLRRELSRKTGASFHSQLHSGLRPSCFWTELAVRILAGQTLPPAAGCPGLTVIRTAASFVAAGQLGAAR
jgi:hypothetical protein